MLIIKYQKHSDAQLLVRGTREREKEGTKLIKLNDNFFLLTIILIDIDSVKVFVAYRWFGTLLSIKCSKVFVVHKISY